MDFDSKTNRVRVLVSRLDSLRDRLERNGVEIARLSEVDDPLAHEAVRLRLEAAHATLTQLAATALELHALCVAKGSEAAQ